MIDAKTALKMTEEVRQKGKNDEVWDKIEKKIISRINAGKQFCEVEVFSDSPISKNEIVERLTSLGYNVTETTYNIDELLNEMRKKIGSSEVVEKELAFVHELVIRW